METDSTSGATDDEDSRTPLVKSRLDRETEMNRINTTIGALRPTQIADVENLLPAPEIWDDEIRKHVDSNCHAERGDLEWQVLICVNLKFAKPAHFQCGARRRR